MLADPVMGVKPGRIVMACRASIAASGCRRRLQEPWARVEPALSAPAGT
jgi:hypothetical protein